MIAISHTYTHRLIRAVAVECLELVPGVGPAVLDPHLGRVGQAVVCGGHILPDITAQVGFIETEEGKGHKDQGNTEARLHHASILQHYMFRQ